MTKDAFHGLILPETQKPTYIQRTVYVLKRNNALHRSCHAVKDDGMPCGCRSVTFDVFCHSHLKQGYGLFTLAVCRQLRGIHLKHTD
jgi:hypothetical protein